MMTAVFAWIAHYGYGAIFATLMLGILGLPVPDETLLMFTGYLVYKAELRFIPALMSAFLGSICGVTVSYMLGRTLGLYLVQRFGHFLHLDAERLERVHAWYDRKGKYLLLFGYFIPGVRHLGAYVAGSSKLPITIFARFAYTGGFLWTGMLITLGYFLGDEWYRMSDDIHRYLIIGASLVVLCLLVGFLFIRWRHGFK
jgi:membrane protein DedA with SNARE-associated domain